MDAEATEHADVVVVGAGPTGLLLAGDLVEAGVRVVLLERRAGESNLTRAFAVHARTMEQLQIRGVAAELAASGTTIDKLVLYGPRVSQFLLIKSRRRPRRRGRPGFLAGWPAQGMDREISRR